MKQVKMLTRMAGPQGTYEPGDLVSLPDDQADELITGRYADLVTPHSKVQQAVKPTQGETRPANDARVGKGK